MSRPSRKCKVDTDSAVEAARPVLIDWLSNAVPKADEHDARDQFDAICANWKGPQANAAFGALKDELFKQWWKGRPRAGSASSDGSVGSAGGTTRRRRRRSLSAGRTAAQAARSAAATAATEETVNDLIPEAPRALFLNAVVQLLHNPAIVANKELAPKVAFLCTFLESNENALCCWATRA